MKEKDMNRRTLLTGLLIFTAGCSTMNNTEKDAIGGGAVGAGAMALATRGNPVATVFGGLVGALVGGSIGASQDRHEEHKAAVQAAVSAQAARQMTINDIVQMAQSGQSDNVIIGQINATGSIFPNMTADDVNYLHQQRVSDQVINYMQQRRYVYVPRPVYVVPPPPPPPVGVGVVVGVR
jgi:surface antigen